ncbi:interferon phi 1 [Scomber scombrus]|uniref:Interferon phi 1 n=1 Tax=Scomber scombrus TaxID=13677 RepID=A0AAV1QBD4_SCOSC
MEGNSLHISVSCLCIKHEAAAGWTLRDTLLFITFITFITETETVFIIFIIFIILMYTVLFLLCGALTPALCCDWFNHQFRHLNGESLKLLQQMGDQMTEAEDSPVAFPYRLYERMRNTQVEESQLRFIRDSLQLIFDLYCHGNHSSVTWDTDKSERFLIQTHRQIEELNQCFSTERHVSVKLRKYYKRLSKSTVERMGGSAASWELIRQETAHHLEQLDLLVASMASRRRSRRPSAVSVTSRRR